MRSSVLIALVVFLITLIGSHVLVLRALPKVIMNRGMAIIAERGVEPNQWYHAPRVTAESSAIVRSSPELAYAACLLDLSAGPLRIVVPSGANYGSLSVFDGDTTNVFVGPLDRGHPVEIVVHQRGRMQGVPPEATAVALTSSRGIALIRRLAPTGPLHDLAEAAMETSQCRGL